MAPGRAQRSSAASLISESGLALGYLIVFGSLLGYSTYEWLLHHASSQLAGASVSGEWTAAMRLTRPGRRGQLSRVTQSRHGHRLDRAEHQSRARATVSR
jgi:hypothetical protein